MNNRIRILLIITTIALIVVAGCKTPLEKHLDKGNHYFDKEKWDEAIIEYTAAIEIDPANAQAYTNRGAAYVEQGKYELAIADYNKASELSPENIIVYYNRSMAYIHIGEYDKAIADCNKIIDELDLKYHWVYFNRAVAYSKKGFYNEALNDFYSAKNQTSNEEFNRRVDQYIEEIQNYTKGTYK